MASRTCRWWKQHSWGVPFRAPIADLETRRMMGIDLGMWHQENHDAFAAFICGEEVQLCRVCGGARRNPGAGVP